MGVIKPLFLKIIRNSCKDSRCLELLGKECTEWHSLPMSDETLGTTVPLLACQAVSINLMSLLRGQSEPPQWKCHSTNTQCKFKLDGTSARGSSTPGITIMIQILRNLGLVPFLNKYKSQIWPGRFFIWQLQPNSFLNSCSEYIKTITLSID